MRFIIVIVAIFFWADGVEAQTQSQRIALVIGNSNYSALSDLANPRVDAVNVSRALERAGFRVVTHVDLARGPMLEALNAFSLEVKRLPRGSAALIYFAGHGFAINGANYLAPTDGLRDRGNPVADMIDMGTFFRTIQADGVAGLAFFDACRNTPRGIRALGTGFVQQESPNSFVAMSAALGDVAGDGGAGLGSPFANAFTMMLDLPGLSPDEMMEFVRPSVSITTGGQAPIAFNNLTSRVVMNPPRSAAAQRIGLAHLAYIRGDIQSSLDLALPLARSGDLGAMRLVAFVYQLGDQRSDNERAALEWLARAMAAGGPQDGSKWATFAVFSPAASQPDRDRAFEIISRNAARGDPDALYTFGYAFLGRSRNGPSNITPNAAVAMRAFAQAAEAGQIEAAVNHGVMSATVLRDRAAAEDSLLRAALSGSSRGMSNYADLRGTFALGQRDEERDADALGWYLRAAELGEPRAMLRLSIWYALGIGVPANRATALEWLERAEAAASPRVRANVPDLATAITDYGRVLRSGRRLEEPLCPATEPGCRLRLSFWAMN